MNFTFTLDGAVSKPGVYEIPGRLTLARALAIGGGANAFGRLKEIVVIREVNGQRYAAKFDLNEIRAGRQPDLPIRQGDLVVVGFNALQRLFNIVVGNLPAAAALFVLLRQN